MNIEVHADSRLHKSYDDKLDGEEITFTARIDFSKDRRNKGKQTVNMPCWVVRFV